MAKVTIVLSDEGDDNTAVRLIGEFEPKIPKGATSANLTAAQVFGALLVDYANQMLDEHSDGGDVVDLSEIRNPKAHSEPN